MKDKNNKNKQIEAAARAAINGLAGIQVHCCMFMSMDTLNISPEYVMMEVKPSLLPGVGEAPKFAQFITNPPDRIASKAAYRAAHKEWDVKAKAAAETQMAAALQKLREAQIRFKAGKHYGWPAARLA